MVLTYGIPPEFRGGVHLFILNRHMPSSQSRVYMWSPSCVPMAFTAESPRRHRASKPQGSSERVLPGQVTMDQLICASLSYTHYWYEVGMLKVYIMPTTIRIDPSTVYQVNFNYESINNIVVVVVFTLKTVLTSIQYPSLSYSLQGKETNFRGHKLTQNKVQKNNDKNKK